MRKIVLLCNMGMSTSMMVSKMKEAASKEGYECEINAYSVSELNEVKEGADCILIGPQIKFKLAEIQAECDGIPVKDINMMDYGVMNGAAVLKIARDLMND